MGTQAQVVISYSHSDKDFAFWLRDRLHEHNVPVWIDSAIRSGNRWQDDILNAIKACSHTLIILSPRSIVSTHVLNEMHCACDLRKIVLPVIYDWSQDCEMPPRLQPIQYIDFTQLHYEEAIKRLVERFATTHVLTTSSSNAPQFRSEPATATQIVDRRGLFEVSADDRWVGGVCAGLAAYWGMSPILVRALFLLGGLVLFSTTVVGPFIVYGILWWMMRRRA